MHLYHEAHDRSDLSPPVWSKELLHLIEPMSVPPSSHASIEVHIQTPPNHHQCVSDLDSPIRRDLEGPLLWAHAFDAAVCTSKNVVCSRMETRCIDWEGTRRKEQEEGRQRQEAECGSSLELSEAGKLCRICCVLALRTFTYKHT